uniref:Keratin 18 n=1 Tax=Ursus maritimus TaxID=29073 RepID=A0A452TWD8_URSMA
EAGEALEPRCGFPPRSTCGPTFRARGLGGGGGACRGGIQGEKETMQDLNDRLASYLERVRSLEADNQRLEMRIREHLEKKGPQVRDWGHYFKTIEELRAQIFASSVDNARIVLQIDNARLAADDFRVKYETELAMRQSVESDIHGLRKVIDDTNVTRLQLETEIEALKEELLFMKKNHEEEVKGLQNQIANSGLTVELDAPKSQDLSKIMADIRAQYDELAQKNREELDKYWSQQIEESTTVVTTQTAEIGEAEMTLTELRRTAQSLEINLDSMRNLKASLENSLREVETRYAMQMEQLNGVLLHLESELSQTRAEGQRQAQEYEALLNVKVKLEAEIATYRRLLEDGEDFRCVGPSFLPHKLGWRYTSPRSLFGKPHHVPVRRCPPSTGLVLFAGSCVSQGSNGGREETKSCPSHT